jgi:hypothetical protein
MSLALYCLSVPGKSGCRKLSAQLDGQFQEMRLTFEGAGGACGEFDGVFGAGFFGVLF